MAGLKVNSTMKRIWRAVEVAAWTAFFGFAVMLLGLRFWVLPKVAEHREQIAAVAARTIGQPVKIGSIEAGWYGLRPQINLSDVRILDAEGREALVLPSIENVLSWSSLLHGEVRLSMLVIDGPRLTVRRDAAGAIYVAGLKLGASPGTPGFTDWLLGHDEIAIRNAEIEWHDEKRGGLGETAVITVRAATRNHRRSRRRHVSVPPTPCSPVHRPHAAGSAAGPMASGPRLRLSVAFLSVSCRAE